MDSFSLTYNGRPPWETGHPQTEFVQLEQAGEIVGSVLDVGCGTGENALHLAACGHDVWGVDIASASIEKARDKAAERHLTVIFLVLNVLELHTLRRTFDTVIDSGLFHVLSDEERPLFVDNLATTVRPGGTYFMLCWSELEPAGGYGPRRITQTEIKDSFQEGWHINYIKPAAFDSWLRPTGPRAWLSSISKSNA